jgi:hypothetical protein
LPQRRSPPDQGADDKRPDERRLRLEGEGDPAPHQRTGGAPADHRRHRQDTRPDPERVALGEQSSVDDGRRQNEDEQRLLRLAAACLQQLGDGDRQEGCSGDRHQLDEDHRRGEAVRQRQ